MLRPVQQHFVAWRSIQPNASSTGAHSCPGTALNIRLKGMPDVWSTITEAFWQGSTQVDKKCSVKFQDVPVGPGS
jgi:hypothetical protein